MTDIVETEQEHADPNEFLQEYAALVEKYGFVISSKSGARLYTVQRVLDAHEGWNDYTNYENRMSETVPELVQEILAMELED